VAALAPFDRRRVLLAHIPVLLLKPPSQLAGDGRSAFLSPLVHAVPDELPGGGQPIEKCFASLPCLVFFSSILPRSGDRPIAIHFQGTSISAQHAAYAMKNSRVTVGKGKAESARPGPKSNSLQLDDRSTVNTQECEHLRGPGPLAEELSLKKRDLSHS